MTDCACSTCGLQRERDEARDALARLAEAGTGYSQQTLDAVSRERDRLRALLREVEWGHAAYCTVSLCGESDTCGVCGRCRTHGHTHDCRFAAELEGR